MGLGDGVFDLRSYLSEWVEMPGRLTESDRDTFRDLLTVLDYFVAYADVDGMPRDAGFPEGNPVEPAFSAIAVRVEYLAAMIRKADILVEPEPCP